MITILERQPKNAAAPSAFTLAELLVVITILGLLAALLLTALSQAKARALRIQCVNNLHQLGVGLQTFLADNHGYPVMFAGDKSYLGLKGYPRIDRSWMGQLEREGLGIPRHKFLSEWRVVLPISSMERPQPARDRRIRRRGILRL